MKLLSLTLRGAWGIFEGIGKDEITIDFSRFSPGLIALVGKNGSGKTTILENLHPYRRLASRDGSPAKHFRLRDSRRDLTFQVGAHVYRALIIIDAQTAKHEAYLYKDGAPVNDGKTTTYDAAIERLLGSDELYFRSIFAAQNAESITSLTAGKRKALFMELLGLDRYGRYEEAAKAKASASESELSGVAASIENARRELERKVEIEEKIIGAKASCAFSTSLLANAQADLVAKEVRFAQLTDAMSTHQATRQSIMHVEADIEKLAERQTAHGQMWKMNADVVRKHAAEIQAEIDRLEKIAAHRSEIEAKVAELAVLRSRDEHMVSLQAAYTQIADEERTAHMEFASASSRYAVEFSQAQNRIRIAESILEGVKTTAELASRVPCSTLPGIGENCELLKTAISARGRISQAQQDVGACVDALTLVALKEPTNGVDYSARKDAVGYDASEHQRVRESITALVRARWEEFAKELAVTSAVLAEKRAAAEELRARSEEQEKRFADENAAIKAELALKQEELARLEAQYDPSLPDVYAEAKAAVALISSRIKTLEAQIADLTATARVNTELLAQMEKAEDALAELYAKEAALRSTVERLRYVATACSKDGIPALELDAAGPAVSMIANELLTSTFGSRYQIAFETTRASSDGKKQIETFEIRVYGPDGEKQIEDLSGGQRVWVEKAIQEAISIYLTEKSGREYLTSYSDEYDGALDPDNKQCFLDMLRESFRIGRRHHTLLITQTPEVWQQVQQRLIMHPETSEVEVVL